jgi:hypothetical protein
VVTIRRRRRPGPVHSRKGNDLGLGQGSTLRLRVVDLVETRAALAARRGTSPTGARATGSASRAGVLTDDHWCFVRIRLERERIGPATGRARARRTCICGAGSRESTSGRHEIAALEHQELQAISVGDLMPWTPKAVEGFFVAEIEPARALVIRGDAGDLYGLTWALRARTDPRADDAAAGARQWRLGDAASA